MSPKSAHLRLHRSRPLRLCSLSFTLGGNLRWLSDSRPGVPLQLLTWMALIAARGTCADMACNSCPLRSSRGHSSPVLDGPLIDPAPARAANSMGRRSKLTRLRSCQHIGAVVLDSFRIVSR